MYKDSLWAVKAWVDGALRVLPKEILDFCILPYLTPDTNYLIKLLRQFPDKPWNWDWLSRNVATPEFVEAHSNNDWNWKILSLHSFGKK